MNYMNDLFDDMYIEVLARVRDEGNMESLEDAAEWVLVRASSFDKEFVDYCIEYLN